MILDLVTWSLCRGKPNLPRRCWSPNLFLKWQEEMRVMKTSCICLLFFSVLMFAKDKEVSAPSPLSSEIKIEIKDAQLSVAHAVIAAQPHDIEVQIKQMELENVFRKAEESCGDLTKWQLNRAKLECELKPPPPPTPEEQCKNAERKDLCIAEKKAQQKK
jgi:hypothetical protein